MKHTINSLFLLMLLASRLCAAGTAPASPTFQRDAILRQAGSRQITGDEAIVRLSKMAIVFYGKVVDQNGAPVPDAEVVYLTRKNFFGEDPQRRLKTDKNGLFEINDRGLALELEISKQGYRKVTPSEGVQGSEGQFDFAEEDPSANHRPIKARPVVFQLRKAGAVEKLLHQRNQMLKFTPDGTPGYWSLDDRRKSKTPGAHRIEMRFVSEKPTDVPAVGRPRFNWTFEIRVENGALVEQPDIDGFEAPQSGYRDSDRIVRTKADADWRDGFPDRSYYIRFNDGVHARITIEGLATLDDYGSPVIYGTSYLNPKAGSRYLEAPLPPPER